LSADTSLRSLVLAQRADAALFIEGRTGRAVTGADLADAVARWDPVVAQLRPGAVVALATADPCTFATNYLGLLAARATVAPVDPGAPAEVLRLDLAELGADALVTEDALTMVPGGRTARHGVLLRSSGSTGPRKLIPLSEPQLLHVAAAVVAAHSLTPDDVCYSPLPLFHVNAQVVGLLSTLVAGSTLVLDQRFSRRSFWSTVATHRVSWLNAVPAILAILEHQGDPHQGLPAGCEQLRFARSASAPLPLPVLRRFEKTYGVPVVETYGMTEAASQICANPVLERRAGSVGRPVEVELEVRDAHGQPVPPETVGQVHIRGRGVVAGALPGGWLATGDLGRQDEDGYLYLTGRVSEVINRGGEKLFPRHIEDALTGDPQIAAAVVVGQPDGVLGEVPVAYIVAHSAGDATSAAVTARARCARLLSRAQQPVQIHIVRSLPTGATGKVSRKRVRELAPELAAGAGASA